MKIVLLNFLKIIRRFKMAVALNILGLSVAFAAFMVIMMQLDYDFGFDKFHKDHDKIFRVEKNYMNNKGALFKRPEAEIIFDSSPHIVASAVVNCWNNVAPFFVEKDGERHNYEETSLVVEPSFFDVFSFDFVEGANNGRLSPAKIIIPLSLSRKLFGDEPAVGKQIFHTYWGTQTVMAVYRDLPANSILENYIYFAMHDSENKDNWENGSYHAYIRIDDAANVARLHEAIKRKIISEEIIDEDDAENYYYYLTNLPDIHYITKVAFDNTPKANKQTLMILFAIAIVIIVIAGINFTNFSTALAPMRAKSINTQRVFGAQLFTMRLSLVTEAVFISSLSFIFSIVLLYWFKNALIIGFLDADLSLSNHPFIIGVTALMALLTGLLIGLYPAYYMTSYMPAMVLSSNFGLSPKGKTMRNSLIGIQFIASIALITCASFIYLQNHCNYSGTP